MRKKRSLVILTLNEIEGVRAVFDRIPRDAADETLVVDGGSTDGTREFFRERGVRVVDQASPGRGEAFRIALREGTGDVFLFFSPDGNEEPADIPRLFEAVEAGADLVIGRRFGPGAGNEEDGKLLPLRAWANRAFTLLANLLFNRGPWVKDSINGFRAVTREGFGRIRPDATGYLIEYQMTIRAMKLGLTITEVPTVEGPRVGAKPGSPSLPTGLRFLRGLAREIRIGKAF